MKGTHQLDTVIQTWPYDNSPKDAEKEVERSYWIQKTTPKYIVYKNHQNQTFPSSKALFRSFPRSRWNHECASALPKIARDERMDDYLIRSGKNEPVFYFPGSRLSDVLYVPRDYFNEFSRAASFLESHEFFLECALPALLQMIKVAVEIKRASLATTGRNFRKKEVSICSIYGEMRGRPSMIRHCWEAGRLWKKRQTIYHPIKLSMVGPKAYSSLLDLVQETNETRLALVDWNSLGETG